jgi:hypothetical protein
MNAGLASWLALINDVLQASVVIFGSGVVLYNLPHWRQDRVTRSFSNLIFFVVVVYFSELLVSRTQLPVSAELLLKFGWLGIVFVPASQFHLSDALLVTTGYFSNRRRWMVRGFYLVGLLFLGLVFGTNLMTAGLENVPLVPHLRAGSFFWLFVVYFWAVISAGIYNVYRARTRCITSTTRRRMTVILLAFLAAPLGVFPYQLLSNRDITVSLAVWLLLIFGNIVVGVMFALLTAYLTYFGRVSPDRVVRVRLFKFMARVPLTGMIVLLVYVLVSRASPWLGLPPETTLAVAVVATVMIVEWAIHQYKQPLERFFQLNDEPEVRRIQQLGERVFTTRDLHQFLESILTATCNTLRTPTGFVAAITPAGPQLEVVVGQLHAPEEIWQAENWQNLNGKMPAVSQFETVNDFVLWEDYWIRPLYDNTGETMIGIMGIEGRSEKPDLQPQEQNIFERLVEQAEGALADRILQQEVFAAVEGLLPSVTTRQRQRSAATYGTASQVTESLTTEVEENEEELLVADPEFTQMVRDALTHYWGGPKMANSPLMRLQVVQEAMEEHDNNAQRALRAILQRAIEQQRPDEGERRMTTAGWILYNILEMKFLQGQKVRDVARRLAMSESDLYRKQRVAIENVARSLATLEREASE